MRDSDSILNNLQNGMSGAEAPGPDAVAQAEEAKAKANEFFKTEKYPLVSYFNNFIELYSRRPAGHLWTTGCPVYSHVFPIFS